MNAETRPVRPGPRSFRPARLLAATVLLIAFHPAAAMKIQILQRLDLTTAMGGPAAGAELRALAHDGTDLWALRPGGDTLARIDPSTGALIAALPLTGAAPVAPAGMTFGAGNLWLLDEATLRLLELDRNGRVLGTTNLVGLPGQPVSVDFRGSPTGASFLLVGYHSSAGGDGLQRYRVDATGLVLDGLEPMTLDGALGRATTTLDGASYTWVSAPRHGDAGPLGDEPDEEEPEAGGSAGVIVPDRSIPRGGEDLESTHALALIDPTTGALLFEVFPQGSPVGDLATDGSLLFYPDPGPNPFNVFAGQFLPDFDVQYGACACREVDFHQEMTFDSTVDDLQFNFANPWDQSLCFGPICETLEWDATGGYLAQQVKQTLDVGPYPFYTQSVVESVGTGSITRHSRSQVVGDGATGFYDPRYEIRVETCEAGYNILPHVVGSLDDMPQEILDLYTWDGNLDGLGDDNPATDLDDYYTIDSQVVHDHLIASGALAEPNLYYKVRKILHYVKRRHAYSGADGGWGTPEKKLESPYSTCSPSSFMVVALARRAGIPARIVGTTKQRGSLPAITSVATDTSFHRWAQVYFPNYGWVRVDATPRGPGSVGMTDLNGDGEYDTCDLCTNAQMCINVYGKTLAECGLAEPLVNPNDVPPQDGVVDGYDIEILGEGLYTEAELDKNSFSGVGMDDLITIVTPGIRNVSSDLLKKDYIAWYNRDGDKYESRQRRADWRKCYGLTDVIVDLGGVGWDPSPSFSAADTVRIDLYRVEGSADLEEYVHITNLAQDVPALTGHHPIDLSGISGPGDHVVVVTHQGRQSADELTSFSAADWHTFGTSQTIQLSGPPTVSDGASGSPMTVAKLDPQGSSLSITWDTSCVGAADHQILFGGGSQLPATSGDVYGLSGAVCSIGNASPYVWNGVPSTSSDPTGLIWWLLVATDGTGSEGSWGTDSSGVERSGPIPGGASGMCGVLDKALDNTCGQ